MNVALNRVGPVAYGGRVSVVAIGFFVTATVMGCNHSDQRSAASRPPPRAYTEPSSAEQRRAEERREERRAEERRAEERNEERRAEERRAEERARERNTPRAVGGGPVKTTTAASAVARVAVARCDREVRCNRVGAKERYASRSECIAKWESDRREDLNRAECPGGIDERQLESCVDSVQSESCGNPLDAIERLNACRTGKLCLK